MNKKSSDFGIIFWLHLVLIVLIYLSPLLFNWMLILTIISLYYVQIILFGDCLLTKIQFHEKGHSFNQYYLSKLGINLSKRKIKLFIGFLIPTTIFLLSLFWQIKMKKPPLVF